ncbi:hypothetical protein Tco_1170396, partial [Tanacetum coccineum]
MNCDNCNIGTAHVLEKIMMFEELLTRGQAILVDDTGNPLKKVELSDDYDSEDEVESVDNDMARSLILEKVDRNKMNIAGIGLYTASHGILNEATPIFDVIKGMTTSMVDVDAGNAPVKSSYANVTGKPCGKKLNINILFTPGGNGIDVVVPVESIQAIRDQFANSAYGFFLGHQVAYPVVKLHGIPVTAFSDDSLSIIATKLGTPLMLDSYTSDMCMQSWGRSSYARAMIELRTDLELKDNIVVAMPRISGRAIIYVLSVLSISGNLLSARH